MGLVGSPRVWRLGRVGDLGPGKSGLPIRVKDSRSLAQNFDKSWLFRPDVVWHMICQSLSQRIWAAKKCSERALQEFTTFCTSRNRVGLWLSPGICKRLNAQPGSNNPVVSVIESTPMVYEA